MPEEACLAKSRKGRVESLNSYIAHAYIFTKKGRRKRNIQYQLIYKSWQTRKRNAEEEDCIQAIPSRTPLK
jgi:hypothetical protein